jgi:hypothetical protein
LWKSFCTLQSVKQMHSKKPHSNNENFTYLAFFAHNPSNVHKKLIITLVLRKTPNFFAENWRKTPKIVLIALTAGEPGPQDSMTTDPEFWRCSRLPGFWPRSRSSASGRTFPSSSSPSTERNAGAAEARDRFYKTPCRPK